MKNYLKSIRNNHSILSAYVALLILITGALLLNYRMLLSLIPFYLIFSPLFFGQKIKLSLKAKDAVISAAVSAIVLTPFSAFMFFTGKEFIIPSFNTVLFQLLAVAIPEEFFFRGFIQERIGHDKKNIVITSLLFSGAHLPLSISSGNLIPLLSFFPSLIIGWLYMKTSNLLPCFIFHFLANIVFISFGGL